MSNIKSIRPDRQARELLEDKFGVSRETMALLQIYVDLLVAWQKKTNLVSNSTLTSVWMRHICDSVQCRMLFPDQHKWLDLGSGGGFPGLVLAILGNDTDGFDIQLVESNAKKCAFLRKVIRETGIQAAVNNARIESVTKLFPERQIVTARALASLENLFELTQSWLCNGAIGLFPKGRDYLQELEKCNGVWQFDLIKHPSLIEENSVLLEIQNLRKTVS